MRKPRRYPNVTSFRDRHGKVRYRYRRTGQPTYYFKNPPDTPGFKEELAACEAGELKVGGGRAIPGSVNDLVARYYLSTDFHGGGAADQQRRRLLLEGFRSEFGDDMVVDFGFEHIEAILLKRSRKRQEGNRTVGGRVAAHNLRKQLRRLFAHAKRLHWIGSNPVDDADKIKTEKTGGYHTWTEDEIARYQSHHKLGTRARLALEIILWTGQRRGDARLFGPDQMKRGKINYRQGKTGKDLWLPAAPQLVEAIEAMQRVGLRTFLVTEYGKPFSAAGFGNKMREWCDEAGLPQCSAHGLRKAIARRLADMGAGNQGIKSVGGWSNDAEVAIYTAAADQERLADATLGKLVALDLANRESQLAKPLDQTVENKG
ncbi:MAG: integrase [Alphaproteobacteria bacterium]|nr:MAG: integrase [Alphaproteobacteria bacterium]